MLAGKVAVITGAGRGIGRAIATGYAAQGAAVVCAARTQTEIEAVATEIQESGGRALAVPTDVTDWQSVQTLYANTTETYDQIDIVVINAGANLDRRPVEDSQPDEWIATLQINLTGAYFCAKAAIPYMKAHGGHIIVIGSGMGHRATSGRSAYASSKAGVWMLTRVLAEELKPYQICVNELIPGPVVTDMNRSTLQTNNGGGYPYALHDEWIKQPEDVVPMALFLASQPLTGPTGQSFSLMRRDSQ